MAAKYHVKKALVSWIARHVAKDPSLLDEIELDEVNKSEDRLRVKMAVGRLLASGNVIWNIDQVQGYIEQPAGKSLTNSFVGSVLRNDLGLKYKKVKAISWKGNTERCKVLR